MNLRQVFFDFQYRFTKPPWDSGVTPPEVVAFVENSKTRGRALDLGCGAGTNSIYLAQHGYQVTGVDFSPPAIATARQKSKRAGLAIDFHIGDVTRLDSLGIRDPFDFVLDIGCLHAIDAEGRARYAEGIGRLTQPGSVFMLYAFSPRPDNERRHWLKLRNVGIAPDQVQKLFASEFALTNIAHGADRAERKSAWYGFRRHKSVVSRQIVDNAPTSSTLADRDSNPDSKLERFQWREPLAVRAKNPTVRILALKPNCGLPPTNCATIWTRQSTSTLSSV